MVMKCTLCDAVVEKARKLGTKKAGVAKAKVCDSCGRLCCKPCCRQYLLLDNPDYDLTKEPSPDKPVRVCTECFKEKSSIDHSVKYDAYGTVGKPGIVMIHGNMANRKMYAHFARTFLATYPNYRIHCLDVPGHGSRMEEELTIETAIAVVKEGVERIYNEYCDAVVDSGWDGERVRHDGRPVVFGYSMGAYISMAVTGVCSEWPIVPRAFAIGGGNFNMNQTGAGLGLSMYGFAMIKIRSAKAWATSLQSQFPHCPLNVIQECFYRAGGHPHIWPVSQKMLLATNYTDALAKYDGPIKFFRGSKDQSDADELWLASTKFGTLKKISGGDHMVFIEFVDEVARMLDRFMRSVLTSE
mmetsp:Transcript_613/g.2160  ORF Transcript_613/g.2160 Transcript_613/m.2160 type:complete len:356 (+) Transcript_613:147-1214(+)